MRQSVRKAKASEGRIEGVALAYSGGLDTSVMIPWLRENHDCRVVAVVADVGQEEDLKAVREKALRTGADDCRVLDLREAFAGDFVGPALRAGAIYEGRYLLGTALARPLIAREQIRVARETGCDALAHGCTGRGNDQVRFELAYGALAPDLRVLAPWREWELDSREALIAYARARGIPVPVSTRRPYSVDRNLWHTSYEGGVLEDPATPAPPDLYERTADPAADRDPPSRITIAFRAGRPVELDGEPLAPAALLVRLNELAGARGVGRCDLVENRVVGMKSRGVYETPAGTVLMAALQDLEALTLDRQVAAFKRRVAERYAELVYRGGWYTPLREALDGFLAEACRHVTGEVTVELHAGACRPVARQAPSSLYRGGLATFGEGTTDHADAGGFIRLFGLESRVHAETRGAGNGSGGDALRTPLEDAPAPGNAAPAAGGSASATAAENGAAPPVEGGGSPEGEEDGKDAGRWREGARVPIVLA